MHEYRDDLHTSFNTPQISRDFERKSTLAQAVSEAGWEKQGARIARCSTMANTVRCTGCGHEFYVLSSRCMHRLCPICGRKRSERLYDDYKSYTKIPNLKHLVLTVKNFKRGKLHEKTKWMRNCFDKLRSRKLIKKAWAGGIYAIEYVYTKNRGWHIHIHALIDGCYVPQKEIARLWKDITNGRGVVVWIMKAGNTRETLKYILKPSWELLQDKPALAELLAEIQGKRLVQSFGKWLKYSEKKVKRESICPNCGCPYLEIIGYLNVLTYIWGSPPT